MCGTNYYVTGNISALTPGPLETLDVDLMILMISNKALLCSFAEAQSTDRERVTASAS